ncbi:ClpP/crotonase-like domain-containing protein [Microdochium bolleyi]|uniref:ClpP/crotonase-like domain-containing protein n=1 Tax=Microdochium bolleyi TaxID=196109 RepID=A0A136ISE9_9PEZI|nr:ClpP/crotonase-like domain-containing protein [Microdochium bolleyi]
MPPRLTASLRFPILRRLYSTAADSGPLIRVTNLPAPGSGHIRVLELNRPSARNAISRSLIAALRAELDDLHQQYTPEGNETPHAVATSDGPTRAVVLASAVDACFCAGADLKERKTFTQKETADFLSGLRNTFNSLSALPIPSICAISSIALGGGLELALTTDLRVVSSNAVVGLPETRLGIIPGGGGCHRLPPLIGASRARDVILTGRRVAGPEAYFLGIADRLVEVHQPEKVPEGGEKEAMLTLARTATLNEAVRLAQEICEGAPVAIRASLEAVMWAREDKENQMSERVVVTEDRNEALKAFAEKRKPVFKGR